jgi:hypothetical protein
MGVEQPLEGRFARMLGHCLGQMGDDRGDACAGVADLEERRFARADVNRLFPIDHAHRAGEAAQ